MKTNPLTARKLLALTFLAGSLALSSAQAAVITLGALDDLTVRNTGDNFFFNVNNYGGTGTLLLSTYGDGGTLARFDTTGLAGLTGATIDSVTLNFTVSGSHSLTGLDVLVGQLLGSNSGWVEGSGNGAGDYSAGGATLNWANKTAGSATAYGDLGTGSAWAGGGNLYNYYSGGNEFLGNAATVYDLGAQVGTYNDGDTFSLTLSDSIIANWMSSPALAAAGLFLMGDSGGGDMVFKSSEAGFAPSITVNYTAVPEPSTWALLGLGVMGLIYLRRHRSFVS